MEIAAPFVLCFIPSLLYSFAAPSSLFNSVFGRSALIFPWNFLLMLFFFDFSKNKKSRLFILFIFFFELSRVFLSPLLKSRWVYCFCFFPSVFFCLFSHSIPTRNGVIWWVYYCGIVLYFGLGLYHHGSNSKPTHTDDDSVGQSNGSGSGSLYLLLLRDF